MPTYPNDMRKSSFQESPPLGRLTPGVLSPGTQKALFGLPLLELPGGRRVPCPQSR